MQEKEKSLLTRTEDRISFLYIEKARIEQTEYSVQIVQGTSYSEIPITTINLLIFGPGVSITHKAIQNIASAGCSIAWMGEEGCKFYTYGNSGTNSSKNILIQMACHENKSAHLEIVKRMYEIRYPLEHLKSKSLEELRGIEGTKVKELYSKLAQKYDIEWNGRKYKVDVFEESDVINQCLTELNQFLYAIIQAAIIFMGFSPAIGFIHTGHMNSFVYDIADLYKEKITIPLAFEFASQNNYNRLELLCKFRENITKDKLMKTLSKDLCSLFEGFKDISIPEIEGSLWNGKDFISGGKNFS